MSKKIALFIPTLNGGGTERVFFTLANDFVLKGFHVDLILINSVGTFLKAVNPTVRIIDLKVKRVLYAFFPLVFYLRKERPAAILTAMTYVNIVAILALKFSMVNSRIVISERSTISLRSRISRGLVSFIIYFLVPHLYKYADSIVSVSKAVAKDLAIFANLPQSKVEYIYNPFDILNIEELSNMPVKHPWFESKCSPVIIAVGRLNEAKDYPTLIKAFSYLRRKTHARLLILGEGYLQHDLQSQINEYGFTDSDVQLIGFVSNPYSYIKKSNLFVLSSIYEGLPGVLIEALVCGVPVVSTDCPSGPSEILEEGRWGRLVPVGDPCALANAIVEVLEMNVEQLPNVRDRAKDFEKDKAVEAYLKLLGVFSN